jgi:NTE family protein
MTEKFADLVLEGGGVKGIALVGAYSVIEERGYRIKRVAGTSAGSIVGAMLAAGMSAAELEHEMGSLDYSKFQDEGLLDRLPLVGKPLSLLFEEGLYEGKFAHTWVKERLAEHDVRTFKDLPYDDPEFAGEEWQRYRLVVMASDISAGSLRRLPWDYRRYGCAADEQLVADAVRASMSIPFFFEPVKIRDVNTKKDSVLVDGGMLSNFPVGVFDAPPDREPRWPTFGIKLSARAKAVEGTISNVHGPVSMGIAMIRTMTGFHDRLHVDEPSVQDRTIFVDTGTVQATDFHLDKSDRDFLFERGRTAAVKFFDGDDGRDPWDWEAWNTKYRPARQRADLT